MTDKNIPGSVWIIIGAGVMLMSLIVGLKSDRLESFYLFILAGAVFIVVGFFKIILKDTKHAKRHVHKTHHAAQHPAKPHTHHAPVQKKPASKHVAHHTKHVQVMRCSNCGVKLHSMFKFCPNCGQKLK